MRYRYLTYQELDMLQEDFNEFLYQEGINKFEWYILQDQQSVDALKLLGKYSELTFEKVMQDISYLYYYDGFQLKSFECQTNRMLVISFKTSNNTKLDFNSTSGLSLNPNQGLISYKCSKTISDYVEDRESDIFKLIEAGCIPTDHKIFKQLSFLRKSYQN
ncbi:MAG: hypothetical protein DWP98_12415 [Bacteroidetes bacterium]|nr:MAG: hypothetical protein DWP98_12415 [Bacteroidota bacterium]MBL1145003.1 hypothetical protein [Bacteroidota bacterium]NOG57800.1 hypothetical protein [Bacteroidota bacterium]